MKQIEKEIEGNRRGVKIQEMPIDKAYELLKEAYEDYSNAKHGQRIPIRAGSKLCKEVGANITEE